MRVADAVPAGVVDLLGVLAYGELSAFGRLARDADLAPSLRLRADLADMAVSEFGHYTLLAERLRELGADPEEAMSPFIEAIDAFHTRTAPRTWLESLVKAYIGDGIALDFYAEVASWVDPRTHEIVLEVGEGADRTAVIVNTVRAAIEQDPRHVGRLSLWGRRLLGEAMAQAQHVAAQRDALVELVLGGEGGNGAGLTALGDLFVRLTERHAARMESLGLNN